MRTNAQSTWLLKHAQALPAARKNAMPAPPTLWLLKHAQALPAARRYSMPAQPAFWLLKHGQALPTAEEGRHASAPNKVSG
jgi:hypothetical protein